MTFSFDKFKKVIFGPKPIEYTFNPDIECEVEKDKFFTKKVFLRFNFKGGPTLGYAELNIFDVFYDPHVMVEFLMVEEDYRNFRYSGEIIERVNQYLDKLGMEGRLVNAIYTKNHKDKNVRHKIGLYKRHGWRPSLRGGYVYNPNRRNKYIG